MEVTPVKAINPVVKAMQETSGEKKLPETAVVKFKSPTPKKKRRPRDLSTCSYWTGRRNKALEQNKYWTEVLKGAEWGIVKIEGDCPRCGRPFRSEWVDCPR
jgi:hypothetical protein